MSRPASVPAVNSELARRGIRAEFVRGDGYHYFVGEDVPNGSHSEYIYRTGAITVAEWLGYLFAAIEGEAHEENGWR